MGPMRQVDELEAATETARALFFRDPEEQSFAGPELRFRRAVYDASLLHGVCKRELYTKLTGARS